MKFDANISEKEYQDYALNHEKSHFLQTYEWGRLNKECRGLNPFYVGLRDNNNKLLCASLLLQKKTPLGYSYFYAPRGFLIDFKNKELLSAFTNSLKIFLKDNKGIYLKVDPDIMYHEIDESGEKTDNGENNYDIYNTMISLGYRHLGFNKLYERNQPRYTFRIDLTKPLDEINSNISKTFMKTVKRSYNYNIEIVESDDTGLFYKLAKNNSLRDNFQVYNASYYKNLYEIFSKNHLIKIFNAVIHPNKLLNDKIEELSILNDKFDNNLIKDKELEDSKSKKERLIKEIELFNPYAKEESLTICSLICIYTKDKAWTLYIGNNDLGRELFAVNRVYYEAIVDAHNRKYKFMDLFGTVGDPHTTYKNLAGIFEFKRKFGGKYIEFIGEFDLINNKLLYRVLPMLLGVYRKFRKTKQ